MNLGLREFTITMVLVQLTDAERFAMLLRVHWAKDDSIIVYSSN